MKILLYSLNFSPELTGIGKYSGEMAAWLAEAGHEVRVVTSPPYYPAWKVGPGYKAGRYAVEGTGRLRIWRCPIWVPPHPGGMKRLLHLASFAVSSVPILIKQMFWRPDVVWTVAPAFFCVPGALVCARFSGARSWLHIQDYEVDAAFDMGLLKGRGVRKFALGVERLLMRRFDRFSTISGRMLELAHGKGVDAERAVLFPNWVDLAAIAPPVADEGDTNAVGAGHNGYRAEWGVSKDQVVALYSGNMGGKQGLEILAETARLLVGEPSVQFVFCGNGAGRADLELRCVGLPNVRFVDLQPLERLGELLGTADIHLLPQRADAADLVMPSKLTGMLASGRAVVATAHPSTELASVVDGCGLVVPPEDPASMAAAIRRLVDEPGLRLSLGEQGRRYAVEHIDKQMVLKRFEMMLESL